MTSDSDFPGPPLSDLLRDLEALAGGLESDDSPWPERQFTLLAAADVLGWAIPQEYGGSEISSAQLTHGYQQIASACLTTSFVLTQFNGACQRIAGSDNDQLKRELLPDLAAGRLFATVGISHLTTSRQHLGKPAVRFERRGSQFVFNGTTPWVTGANRADQIVMGADGDDGKQILAAIPTAGDGVTINEPPSLLALNASQTGSVDLCDVRIDESRLVAGPVEKVMKQATGGGTGSLNTSALAAGTTVGTLRRLKAEAEKRPDLEEIYDPLASELNRLTADIERSVAATCDSESVGPVATAEEIRQRANSLVLRAAQAYLGAAKGAGFVRGHHAERAVREAMFFLVWSCPQPVLTAALREFACIH